MNKEITNEPYNGWLNYDPVIGEETAMQPASVPLKRKVKTIRKPKRPLPARYKQTAKVCTASVPSNYEYGLKENIRYYNFLDRPVTMIKRNGVRFTFEPIPTKPVDTSKRGFLIETSTSVFDDVKINELVPLDVDDSNSLYEHTVVFIEAYEDELKRSAEIAKEQRRFYSLNNGGSFDSSKATVDMEVCIKDSDLSTEAALDHGVYLATLDIVLVYASNADGVVHPVSEAGMLLGTGEAKTEDGFYHHIKIVDNDGHVGPKYVNINNHVVKITPVPDVRKPDGIHITNSHDEILEDGTTIPAGHPYHREFKDAEALGFYNSATEAHANGDLKTKQLRELEQLRVDNARLAQELANVTTAAKIIQTDREIKKEEMKDHFEEKSYERKNRYEERKDYYDRQSHYRKDYHDEESHRRKDYYDERAHKRKDKTDFFKSLTGIITSVATAITAGIMLFAKWKSS